MECPGRKDAPTATTASPSTPAAIVPAKVDVLVVNHAVYCVHLAAGGNVLPPHDLVVIDEAHVFPDNATSNFGADLAPVSITRLVSMLEKAGAKDVDRLERDREDVDEDRRSTGGPHRPRRRRSGGGRVHGLRRVARRRVEEGGHARDRRRERAAQLADARLEVLRRLAAPLDGDVLWIEKFGNSTRVRMAPVDVGGAIRGSPPRAASGDRSVGDAGRRATVRPLREPDGVPQRTRRSGTGVSRTTTASVCRAPDAGVRATARSVVVRLARQRPVVRGEGSAATGGASGRCRPQGERAQLVDAARAGARPRSANVEVFRELSRATEHNVLAQGDAQRGPGRTHTHVRRRRRARRYTIVLGRHRRARSRARSSSSSYFVPDGERCHDRAR